jgi:hypothetical protein
LLLEYCLGITVQPTEQVVEFSSPQLPEAIDQIELANLRVGKRSVDLRLRRDGDEISVDVLRTVGGIKIGILR